MNKTIHRIAGLIMALVMILGNTINTRAAGNVYYVSPTGSDINPGTASAPFKTFAKGISMLSAGDTLNMYAGVYNEQLKITKSGTSTAGITFQGLSGKIIVDMRNTSASGLDVRASYVTVSNMEFRNSREVCVNLTGSNITVNGLVVHDCGSHGIQANNASNVNILNNGVYRTVLSNEARTASGGWGSAIKVRESNNILIQGNIVYNNYGEGIASTRGSNVVIRNNTVYDNFSVNIYVDNSFSVLAERNLVTCQANSGFERNGSPATGIGMGEEFYTGWGAKLDRVTLINNIVAFCKHGVRYNGVESGVTGGGLKNATIAYNTFYGSTNSAISIVYASAQTGSLIANNIVWQANNNLVAVDNSTGLTFQNNLWKTQPPAVFQSPGDRIGDPQISDSTIYRPESYRPVNSSPAAGGATDIGITNDFFANHRGPTYDIGAIQFTNGTMSANSQATASPTSTIIQLTNTLLPSTLQSTPSPDPTTIQPTNLVTSPSATSINPTVMSTSLPPTSISDQPTPTATLQPKQPPSPSSQETIYNNTHTSFVYSKRWVEEVDAAAIGKSFARTSKNGASITFQFIGQSFSVIYKGGPRYGKMDVYIDGVLVGTINQQHDTSTYKARWDYPGQLSAGQHTLKLVFVATKSTNLGSVDAVIVR